MAIIFLDVDGTLVDSKTHKIPKSTIRALIEAQRNNHKLVIATGRHFTKLMEIEQIKDIRWDGFILDNGSIILDSGYNALKKLTLDNLIVEELINTCIKENLKLSLQLKEEMILPLGIDQYVKSTYNFLGWSLNDNIRAYNNEEVVYALVYDKRFSDFSRFEKLGVAVYPNNSDYADINNLRASKAFGINYFKQQHQMETYCFGDGANDISMFKVVDQAIAMGNACIELKDCASYITQAVDDNGIYNAFKHFKLI